ncbi:5-formyltetrahydrofolate cyclo-ligase [hydrothermal vent metagenome]|uniref:5-formyltetrahydrofolate cyclo-ligase n=1 Tax=hydrothermal vent metagenome TaxID=652676 RepID=A0A3B0Y077_9ZZZZ
MTSRSDQRKKLRKLRRAIEPGEHQRRSRILCQRLMQHRLFRNSRRIAVYLAADGEVDTRFLIDSAWALGKQVYLPVLRPFGENHLWFARYEPDTPLFKNRYDIAEPEIEHVRRIEAFALDLVLVPLVGFDARGNRLGMGGGFYDRSFAHLLRRRHWQKPRLIGLAFDLQQVNYLPAKDWDVPLCAVATEHRITEFK